MFRIFCRQRIHFAAGCKEWAAAPNQWSVPGDLGRATIIQPKLIQSFMHTHHHDYPTVHMPQVPACRLLEGQTAIVTGASSGIGKSVAVALGAAGANVCVNYLTGPDKAEAVVEEIEEDGSHAFAQQADVSIEAEVLAMFEAASGEFGSVDILVNKAGLQVDAPFAEMTRAQWQKRPVAWAVSTAALDVWRQWFEKERGSGQRYSMARRTPFPFVLVHDPAGNSLEPTTPQLLKFF
jgi:short chain dehydrogenase